MDHGDDPCLTRKDFACSEDYARYLIEGGMETTEGDPKGQFGPGPESIGGNGPFSGLYRGLYGVPPAKRQTAFRPTDFLEYRDFSKLYEAIRLANCQRCVLNAMISITWSTVGITQDHAVKNAHGEFLELLRKWCGKRSVPLYWIWVLENGDNFGIHSHIMVHVPNDLKVDLRKWVPKAVETIAKCKPVFNRRSKIYTIETKVDENSAIPSQWRKFRYMMKGMNPDAYMKIAGHPSAKILVSEVGGLKVVPQGRIWSKRAGVSQDLDKKAQAVMLEHRFPNGARPGHETKLNAQARLPEHIYTDDYYTWSYLPTSKETQDMLKTLNT